MRPEHAFSQNYKDKTREELVDKLESLSGYYSRLKAVVQRYERVARKKDIFSSLYDLEAERDRIKELQAGLRKKYEETDQHSEELEVQKEELNADMEELRSREEAALAREAQLKAEQEEERCKVAMAIEAERKRFFEVLENLPAFVYLQDRDHSIRYVNQKFREIFGEPRNRPCYKVIQCRDTPCPECPTFNVFDTLQPQLWEFTDMRGDTYQIFDYPIKDADGTPLVLEMGIDITERKRTEEALKLTQFAMDNFRDSSIWLTPEGSIVYVNGEACRSLGYSRAELLSMHIWDIDPSYTRQQFRGLWPEKKKARYNKFESEHVTRDGKIFPVEVTSSYMKYGDKEYLITFDRDITERKRTEALLEKAKTETELYLDLMGHDINNMHQIALGYLELAVNMPAGKEQVSFMNKSAEVLKRSAQLISNVKNLQKLHQGMFQTHDIDIVGVLRDLHREYGSIPRKQVTLNVNGYGHCYIRANDLLHDVYANLITNAIKHTGDTAEIAIGMDVKRDNGVEYCRVLVEDNGPGIPDEKKATIFDRTLKGSNKAKGMGLGLYIVKTLVESYSGRVWVEDRAPGDFTRGSKFVVMLPMVKREID